MDADRVEHPDLPDRGAARPARAPAHRSALPLSARGLRRLAASAAVLAALAASTTSARAEELTAHTAGEIQAHILTLEAADGGTVHIPAGTYPLAAGIVITGLKPILLDCEPGAILAPGPGIDAVTVGSAAANSDPSTDYQHKSTHGFAMSNCAVHGTGTGYGDAADSGTALILINHRWAHVTNFYSNKGTGGILLKTAANGSTQMGAFHNMFEGITVERGAAYGMKFLNDTNTASNFITENKLANCYLNRNGVAQLIMENLGTGNLTSNQVVNCTFEAGGNAAKKGIKLVNSDINHFTNVIFDIPDGSEIDWDAASDRNQIVAAGDYSRLEMGMPGRRHLFYTSTEQANRPLTLALDVNHQLAPGYLQIVEFPDRTSPNRNFGPSPDPGLLIWSKDAAAATDWMMFRHDQNNPRIDIGNGTLRINENGGGNGLAVNVPAVQTIAGGATVSADACGGLKRLAAAAPVKTSASQTFSAPNANNEGCVMHVCNAGGQPITLDNNAAFRSAGASDVVLGPDDCVSVGSTGAGGVWYQLAPVSAN